MANIFFSIEKIILFKKRKKENGALSRKRVEQGKQLTEEQLLAGGGEGRLCAGTPRGWSGRGGACRVAVPSPQVPGHSLKAPQEQDCLPSTVTAPVTGGSGCHGQTGPTGQCQAGPRGGALLGRGEHLSGVVSHL